MRDWFIGCTGRSFFDVWTIAHTAFWLFVGSVIWPLTKDFPGHFNAPRLKAFAACMAAAYSWELFERFAEKQWPTKWLHPESWWNSYVSDPLTTVVGVWVMVLLLDRFAR